MYILTIIKIKDLNRISSNTKNLVRIFCFQVSLHYCIITLGGKKVEILSRFLVNYQTY